MKDQQDTFTTTSINTAAWLIGRGFEPIGTQAQSGKPALVFPVAARPALGEFFKLRDRAAALLVPRPSARR